MFFDEFTTTLTSDNLIDQIQLCYYCTVWGFCFSVANLTVRIKYLGEHMTAHHKDKHTAYGLNKLVHRRRALLRYLKKSNVARYYKLIVALQLRDVV